MQKWMDWLKELTDKGHITDPGHPLERSGKVVKGSPKTVPDGPFAEAKDVVGGYNPRSSQRPGTRRRAHLGMSQSSKSPEARSKCVR
jgi:hypothetical protein